MGSVKRSSPSQRRLAAQVAINTRWSREDGVEGTAAARAAFMERFEREVDPNGVLAPPERARRAANARKAYFARLALKSAKARSQRRAGSSGESETADVTLEQLDVVDTVTKTLRGPPPTRRRPSSPGRASSTSSEALTKDQRQNTRDVKRDTDTGPAAA